MKTKVASDLCQIFHQWRLEDRKLALCIDQVRDWMWEVNQLGVPQFGETAVRMQPLRKTLVVHFEREDEILQKLSELYSASSPEIEAFRRQTALDHRSLLTRLDDLDMRLTEVDPQFESWTAAMNEVDVFFEAMQQHELQESDRIGMLMPSECGDDDMVT